MSAEFLETLSAEARFALAQELHDALMGGNSIGHTSLVVSVCKDHNVPQVLEPLRCVITRLDFKSEHTNCIH